MEILQSKNEDLDTIMELYAAGTAYQKLVAEKHWQGFDRAMVQREIDEERQYKIIESGSIACVFAAASSDALIWKERNADPAIYLHRIATHPDHRGKSYVKSIIDWARDYALTNGKQYIRMDTGSGNERLNNYYISCGFSYLGITEIGNAEGLPLHYRGGSSSLFEIKIF